MERETEEVVATGDSRSDITNEMFRKLVLYMPSSLSVIVSLGGWKSYTSPACNLQIALRLKRAKKLQADLK
jgi:hypothetical protein